MLENREKCKHEMGMVHLHQKNIKIWKRKESRNNCLEIKHILNPNPYFTPLMLVHMERRSFPTPIGSELRLMGSDAEPSERNFWKIFFIFFVFFYISIAALFLCLIMNFAFPDPGSTKMSGSPKMKVSFLIQIFLRSGYSFF